MTDSQIIEKVFSLGEAIGMLRERRPFVMDSQVLQDIDERIIAFGNEFGTILKKNELLGGDIRKPGQILEFDKPKSSIDRMYEDPCYILAMKALQSDFNRDDNRELIGDALDSLNERYGLTLRAEQSNA